MRRVKVRQLGHFVFLLCGGLVDFHHRQQEHNGVVASGATIAMMHVTMGWPCAESIACPLAIAVGIPTNDSLR